MSTPIKWGSEFVVNATTASSQESSTVTALADGRFVISVEIDPPRSVRIERTIEAARLLQEAGVDLVNVSDSAMARVRMGAMAVAFGVQHDVNVECVVHTTTRDRNLMALESELLGAHALGVRNILSKPVDLRTLIGEIERLTEPGQAPDASAPSSAHEPRRGARIANPKKQDRPQ